METRVRKVKQNFRIFTESEKKRMVSFIDKNRDVLGVVKSCEKAGIGRSQYYDWKNKFDLTKVAKSGKRFYNVTFKIEVDSYKGLTSFCDKMRMKQKVRSIVSVR